MVYLLGNSRKLEKTRSKYHENKVSQNFHKTAFALIISLSFFMRVPINSLDFWISYFSTVPDFALSFVS